MDDYSVADEYKISQEEVDFYMKRLRKLESGPGGIMEMKQTISDLERYRNFVWAFYNEPMEMSYHKLPEQYRYWKQIANELIEELEGTDNV
jgi:hypothetical protein